jgi:hypothetical protein
MIDKYKGHKPMQGRYDAFVAYTQVIPWFDEHEDPVQAQLPGIHQTTA